MENLTEDLQTNVKTIRFTCENCNEKLDLNLVCGDWQAIWEWLKFHGWIHGWEERKEPPFYAFCPKCRPGI